MQKKQTLKRSESVAFCGLAIALITIGAWVTVPLGPVPFTLQTMVLAFVVLLLPAREAVASVAGYVVLGALGVPVFSGMAGGLAKVMGPTGGFIIGFVLGGLAYSGVTPTNSAFCRAYFGPAHYPVNFPLINSNLIFASFGSTVSGALYDAGGSYNSTFFLIIGLAAAGILCSLAISAIDKKSK